MEVDERVSDSSEETSGVVQLVVVESVCFDGEGVGWNVVSRGGRVE